MTYTQGGQPNLSGEIVKSVELSLPTIDEQTAIATILSDMDVEIAALEAKLVKARQTQAGHDAGTAYREDSLDMKEHQHIEWKESWRDECLKWICGFRQCRRRCAGHRPQ